MPEGGVARMY